VTAAFLEQVREVCQQNGVKRGTVRGLIRGRRIALGFSRNIPSGGQQRLRNWWAHSGWAAKPARAPWATKRGLCRTSVPAKMTEKLQALIANILA
jgi:hypothetical protein